MWLNQYDIDDLVAYFAARNPLYSKYANYLQQWVEVVNSNSDGWAYWRAGSSCAEKLMSLLYNARRGTPVREEELKRSLSAIKACATRHKLPAPVLAK